VNRSARFFRLGLVLAASFAVRGSAQTPRPQSPTPAQMRDIIIEDSLTPAKMQLRNFVTQLRDTLNSVQALHASITRNLASGVTSVVLSNGRELGKRCRVGGFEADLTSKRVATMYTSDPRGDQALNSYRAGLTALIDDFKTCQHDDSIAMAAATPDPKRIEQVSAAASDAVTRYDSVRDALLKLLNITLPFKGTFGTRSK
jgi:hypothetical protein